jgi:hypothetical protein
VGGLVVVVLAGFVGMMRLEETNTFCGWCHTQPESTYLARMTATTKVDLASDHFAKKLPTRCIDCHSGEGLTGRAQALMMGARNAFRYVTGTAIQPAKMVYPIGDANCLKCHADVMTSDDFNNHFHYFLPRWQLQSSKAASCVECHVSHNEKGDPAIGYLDQQSTQQVCQRCHNTIRE